MVSEALELHVYSRRINHTWCPCVVSHGHGGLSGGIDGGGG